MADELLEKMEWIIDVFDPSKKKKNERENIKKCCGLIATNTRPN